MNGRSQTTKAHSLFSSAYVFDTINFSRHLDYKNHFVLHQKYVEEGLSVKDLCVLMGCGSTTLKKQLREFGIKKNQTPQHRASLKYGVKMASRKPQAHKRELEIKETIISMYKDEGLSPTSIARLLTQMKIPTKKQGKKWDHSTIIKILKRENLYLRR